MIGLAAGRSGVDHKEVIVVGITEPVFEIFDPWLQEKQDRADDPFASRGAASVVGDEDALFLPTRSDEGCLAGLATLSQGQERATFPDLESIKMIGTPDRSLVRRGGRRDQRHSGKSSLDSETGDEAFEEIDSRHAFKIAPGVGHPQGQRVKKGDNILTTSPSSFGRKPAFVRKNIFAMSYDLLPLTILSASIAVGTETEDWTLAEAATEDAEARVFLFEVFFSSAFPTPPVVHLGLTGFDIDKCSSARISLTAEAITCEGFTARISTWRSSRVYSVEFNWMALGS